MFPRGSKEIFQKRLDKRMSNGSVDYQSQFLTINSIQNSHFAKTILVTWSMDIIATYNIDACSF